MSEAMTESITEPMSQAPLIMGAGGGGKGGGGSARVAQEAPDSLRSKASLAWWTWCAREKFKGWPMV